MIIKIIASLIVFILTSIVAYMFKVRQLYAVIPKLYRSSVLSEEGTVSEIVVYNKGNKTEEDIRVEIDQEVRCELLATTSSEIQLTGNVINIPRLHVHSDVSLVLLIENGVLSDEKILSISSKECKGLVYKKVEELPPASSSFAIGLIVFIGIIISVVWLPTIINYANKEWVSYNYSHLEKNGWKNIENYITSNLEDSYKREEFPVRFLKYELDGSIVKITYELINKSALPIKVTIKEKENEYAGWYKNYLYDKDVETLSKKIITIEALRTESGLIDIEFYIKYADDFIYDLLHTVKIEPYKEATDKLITKKLLGLWELDNKLPLSSIIEYKKDDIFELTTWTNKSHKKLLFTVNGKWSISNKKLIYFPEMHGRSSYLKSKEELREIVDKIIKNDITILNISGKIMTLTDKDVIYTKNRRVLSSKEGNKTSSMNQMNREEK